MLGLEIPRQRQAVNLGWLLLVPGLGPLSKKYGDWWLSEAIIASLRIKEVAKHEPKPAIHMEKQLGWAHRLGGVDSLGISKAGQTMLTRLMEYDTSLSALLGEGLEKRQWPLLALIPDTSVSRCIPLVPFKLLPGCWNSERVSLSR